MSLRQAASQFRLSKGSLEWWVARTRGQRLDRVDWSDRKRGRAWNRSCVDLERVILELRIALKASILGECGADAILKELRDRNEFAPSRSTVNRILGRYGYQQRIRRVRRAAPPKGWYLPAVASGQGELDCFDFVEDLRIQDGPLVQILNARSLHGNLVDSWAMVAKSTTETVHCIIRRWQADGAPQFAQFDNDTVFQGAHHFADTVGRVSRLCLQANVTPVFPPPREHGPQNPIESFNDLLQRKLWRAHHVSDMTDLQRLLDRYVQAFRAKKAPYPPDVARQELPQDFDFDPTRPMRGQMIFIRRTDDRGSVQMLGHYFPVTHEWLNRLVRCEVNIDQNLIRCFALRRRTPATQPLLATIPYTLPQRPYRG